MILDNNPLTRLIQTPVEKDTWAWGTVTSLTPILVVLDGDTQPVTAPVESLVPVDVGSRVRIHIHQRRILIIGANTTSGASAPDNSLWINGAWWRASGIQSMPSYTWAVSNTNGWYATSITFPLPYTPPVGYGFSYSILTTSSFTILSNAGKSTATGTLCRLMNFLAEKPSGLSAQWHLVKQS